jgi:hypothetical protein
VLSAVLLPRRRTYAHVSTKGAGIGKASLCGDFRHCPGAQAKKRLGLLEPPIHQVAMWRDAHGRAKQPCKMEKAHLRNLRQILKAKIGMAVLVNVIEHMLQTSPEIPPLAKGPDEISSAYF